MIMMDTHTHLYLEQFDSDRNEVIEKAIEKGVTHMFLPNIDKDSAAAMHSLCEAYPKNCFPMMGVHPTSIKEDFPNELNIAREYLENNKYYAIGEIGIDLYWDKTFKEQQVVAFEKQIDWALEFDLPIVIHGRESFDEIFEVLDRKNTNKLRGVFHCFSGNIEQAKKALSYGDFYLGFGGVITFKKSKLVSVIEEIELKDIVLETDSPFLSPTPYRGKRNESGYIPLIAQKIADIKGISIEEVAEQTTANSKNLFNI